MYELNSAGVICFSDFNPQAFLPTFGFVFLPAQHDSNVRPRPWVILAIFVMNLELYVALSLAACTASAFLFIQAKHLHELVLLPLLRDVIFFI
jgi:hypothetical protein